MSETEATRPVLEREREPFAFPALEVATVVAADDPPVDETPPFVEDTFVPDDVEQRLIYYWLCYGPKEWAATVCTLENPYPTTPPGGNVIEVNPMRFRRPRTVGFDDDGLRRVMVYKE